MPPLQKLLQKKTKLVIGLMSGTSVDCIDAVLLKVRGSGTAVRCTQLAFVSYPYPKGMKELILENSQRGKGSVDMLSTLNVLVAHCFADAARATARKAKVPLSKIDLIGSHGQTVHHFPAPQKIFGKTIRSTLQLGDPSTIAKLTGIITVGDFRTGDMALGGEGAPLIPYFDYLAFRSTQNNRMLLNLGGIANMTLLPKNCSVNDVRAFDTGPGNMLIDAVMKLLYKKEFDISGEIAHRGKILPSLLSAMMRHSFFSKKPPKSTGREIFGNDFVRHVIQLAPGTVKEDIIATLTEFTALTVFDQYQRFGKKYCTLREQDEMIISGGGSKNNFLVESLAKYFSPASVRRVDEFGISSDAKEAICFALLANETIAGNPTNIPQVTGALHRTVLGKICL